MTVLRSRKIIPKSPPKTLKTRGIEPSTPTTIHEPSMTSTPSPPLPPPAADPKPDVLGLGFDSESVAAPVSSLGVDRRRSLRLASKSKIAVEDRSKNSITGKEWRPKNTAGENAMSSNVEKENESSSDSDSGNAKGKSGEKFDSRVLGSRTKKTRVFESFEEEKVIVSRKVMDSDELGSKEIEFGSSDEESKEIMEKCVMDIDKLGLSSGSGSMRRRRERLVKGTQEKGKKKLDVDLNSLPLEDGSDKGFLSSPSGPRIGKRKMEVINVDSDGMENDDDISVPFERDGKGEDKERQQRLTEESRESDVEILDVDPTPIAEESIPVNGRYSREEKGKGKLVKDSWLSIGLNPVEFELEPEEEHLLEDAVSSLVDLSGRVQLQQTSALETEREIAVRTVRRKALRRREGRERFQDTARQNASRFAHFQPEVDNSSAPVPRNGVPSPEDDQEIEDWCGPFSTAMKIIKDRNMKLNAQKTNPTSVVSKPAPVIEWMPSTDQGQKRSKPLVPSLQDLSLKILAKNAEAIISLRDVPDTLRNKLSQLLCDSRKMDCQFMDLLVSGSPTEIRVKDCSWITKEQLTKTREGCDTKNLTVLQLDLCGRCMSDDILHDTLARSPNSLPALISISLRGACRLSDVGLNALVVSAPALRSINLGQCSLLTATGVNTLADSLGSILRELYIDDCQNVDAMLILPGLKKIEHLEVLSVAGIQTVCDDFIREFITVRGPNMKELVLADCGKLSDTSLKVIAESCSGLCSLDLVNLRKLTDSSIGYLTNGCQSIETLKLCRNDFSDEAIAAFLETSGESLTELSLNNVKKVGHNTAISLARRCSIKLRSLDLSWCRNLAEEAVGLIVDSCLALRVLKLFGCTQITDVFLLGHSNPSVRIIGYRLSPILEHLHMFDPQEAPLRYSSVPFRTESQSLPDPGL